MPRAKSPSSVKPEPKAKSGKAPSLTSFEQRALSLATPGPELAAVCLALTAQAKNLYNTTHFAVNNVLTAYEASTDEEGLRVLKSELHANQVLALERFNAAVAVVNAARQAKFDALIAQGGEKAKDAKLHLLPTLGQKVQNVYRVVLDITVLDNLLRGYPNEHGVVVYGLLPAKAAQLVLHRYKAAWAGFFESRTAFLQGASAMTGMPRPPSYLDKKAHFVVELPLTQMGQTLPNLGARCVPVDFESEVSLTESQLSAWNNYRIGDAVAKACLRRGYGQAFEAQHLRIVPHKNTVKLEAVVRVARALPADSLLAQLEVQLGKDLPGSGAKRNTALVAAVQQWPALQSLRLAGVDFGVKNTAAIAYSTGHKAHVVSAGRLEAVLGAFDARLDAMVSGLTSPELRALQARKEELRKTEAKLSRSDEMQLRKGLKAIFANAEYRKLRGQRERWLADYLHKLSRGMLDNCLDRGVQVLVLGQNKGWKDGMNLGAMQNRRFGRIPVARLIELLTYKAEAAGLVVLKTEESYTSKTSFVNNEALKKFTKEEKKEKKAKKASKGSEAAVPPLPASKAEPTPTPIVEHPAPMGKRLKDERNTFVNYNQTGRWAKVQADVNAAFNMLRKVFKDFAYHAGLTLKYTVLRLSPRLGLTVAQI